MNYYKSQISNDIFVRKQRPPMTPCIVNRTMLGNFRIGFESIFKSSMHSTLTLRFLPLFFGSHAENEITFETFH